jgi:ornithine decarboxylase
MIKAVFNRQSLCRFAGVRQQKKMNDVPLDTILRDPLTPTPTLVLNFPTITSHYLRFIHAMPGGLVYYAMKANANPAVIQHLVDLGGGLEIASATELDLALAAGAAGNRIICSNPIKNPTFLARMKEHNVYALVVDSPYEVEKVARFAPGCQVYVRLAVDNTGSVLPLAGKFGVDSQQARDLFDQARELGLRPIGLSFHVGSQCLRPQNWANAIWACGDIWQTAARRGHELHFLNIGGGFPVGHYHNPAIPTIEDIGAVVMDAVQTHIPAHIPLTLVMEPGRGLVGEAGHLLASVVGKARRGTDTWLYLDAGVFNGLMETFEGFPPVVRLVNDGLSYRPPRVYTLAGPSCDSCDVIARNIDLPEVHIGDRLVFLDAGAYTNEYATTFNGFDIPRFMLLNQTRPDSYLS